MAYIANKEFRAEGRLIHQGEIIDAETWKTKGSLVSLGWISYIPEHTKVQDNTIEQTQKRQTNKTLIKEKG